MDYTMTTYFDVDNIFNQKTTATRTTTNAIYPSGVFVLAFPIQIRMPATETGTTTSSSFSTPNITSITITTSNSHGSNTSLSGGAIAGIAVGAFAVGAFIFAVLGFFLYRSIIRRLDAVSEGSRVSRPEIASKPELDGQGSVSRSTPLVVPELEGGHVSA
jgi:hypothetical protein